MDASEWVTAAEPVVERMREAVTRVVNAGVGRTTLKSPDLLYEALLGFQYLGDCRSTFANLPPGTPSQQKLAAQFDLACDRFVRATSLFTAAVESDRPAFLREAVREAIRGDVHVRRVEAELS